MRRIPAASIDYLRVPVTETTANIDPTSLPVDIALINEQYVLGSTAWTEPGDDDWQAAEWAPGDGPPYTARLLIGDVEGDFQVWIRIEGDPEHPVRRVGRIVKGNPDLVPVSS